MKRQFNLPDGASLDFNTDRGYRMSEAHDDSDSDDSYSAPADESAPFVWDSIIC